MDERKIENVYNRLHNLQDPKPCSLTLARNRSTGKLQFVDASEYRSAAVHGTKDVIWIGLIELCL